MLVFSEQLGICEVISEFKSDNIDYYVVKIDKNHFYTGIPIDEVEEI